VVLRKAAIHVPVILVPPLVSGESLQLQNLVASQGERYFNPDLSKHKNLPVASSSSARGKPFPEVEKVDRRIS
jgi:hypothetical protein